MRDLTVAKAWAAGAGLLVTALTAALSDDVLDINDATQIGLTVVTIVGSIFAVWKTSNGPKTPVA